MAILHIVALRDGQLLWQDGLERDMLHREAQQSVSLHVRMGTTHVPPRTSIYSRGESWTSPREASQKADDIYQQRFLLFKKYLDDNTQRKPLEWREFELRDVQEPIERLCCACGNFDLGVFVTPSTTYIRCFACHKTAILEK